MCLWAGSALGLAWLIEASRLLPRTDLQLGQGAAAGGDDVVLPLQRLRSFACDWPRQLFSAIAAYCGEHADMADVW